MKETRVFLLDGGTMTLDHSYMFLDAGLTGPREFPVFSVLVDHADGLFLFDSGFDLKHTATVAPFTDPKQTEAQTIPAQLELAGFSADEVTHVLNSHYHIDHVGGNRFCRHAKTVCHQCELEAFASPAEHEQLGYSDTSFAPGVRKGSGVSDVEGRATDIFTPRFETLTGDQEIAKGVTLFETIGHTAGHYSLMVKLADRRPMIFCGDACYSQKNLDMNCIQSGNRDPAQALASMARLKSLAERHEAQLIFSHDPETYPEYRKAPGFYS